MNAEQLKKIIDTHKPLSTRYFDQKAYKFGENSEIYREGAKPEPDNRIPMPFIRRMVKLLKGYFAKVGNITYSDPETKSLLQKIKKKINPDTKPKSWFNDYIKPIYDKEGEEVKTAELFEDALTYGHGFELHWFDKDTGFHFASIPIDQCIPIYSDDLEPKMKEFVWYRKLQDDTEAATWYDDKKYIEYRRKSNTDEWKEESNGIHLYGIDGRVPVVEATIDRDKKNFFDHILPLLDAYDKLNSSVANEHEKFANSILLLRDKINHITKDSEGLTDVDKIAIFKILDSLGENVHDAAAYLERNVNDTFIFNTVDRWERLLYEMTCTVNYSADNFAEASGRAQAYKLLLQELVMADAESYFVKALYDRIELIANHKASQIPDKEKAKLVTVSFRRNVPFDLESTVNVACVAIGGKQLFSRRTALGLFPTTIVPDIDAEIEAVKAETALVASPFTGEEPGKTADEEEDDEKTGTDDE